MPKTLFDRSTVKWEKWTCPFPHKLRDRNGVSLSIAKMVRFYRRTADEEVRGRGVVADINSDGTVVINVTGGSRMRIMRLPYKRSIPVGESIGQRIEFLPTAKTAPEPDEPEPESDPEDEDEDEDEDRVRLKPPERVFYTRAGDLFGEEWVEVVRA